MVSHSNDGEFDTDPRLVKVPSMDYEKGSQRPIFFSPESYPRYVGRDRGIPEYYEGGDGGGDKPFEPIGYIPQVEHTFAYLEDTYGAVNEKQVRYSIVSSRVNCCSSALLLLLFIFSTRILTATKCSTSLE